MATKQSTSKKTTTASIENAAGAAPARAANPATPRVKTVKHSKATVTEPMPAKPVATPVEDGHSAIAVIAYLYWADRGFQGGSPADDWFRAEAEYRHRSAAL